MGRQKTGNITKLALGQRNSGEMATNMGIPVIGTAKNQSEYHKFRILLKIPVMCVSGYRWNITKLGFSDFHWKIPVVPEKK